MGTYLTDFIYLILEAIDFLMVYLVLFHLKLKKPLQVLEILAMAAIRDYHWTASLKLLSMTKKPMAMG